jgi:hypothetical protein
MVMGSQRLAGLGVMSILENSTFLGAGDDSRKGSAARADLEGDGVHVNAVVRVDAIVHIGRPEGYIQVYLDVLRRANASILLIILEGDPY